MGKRIALDLVYRPSAKLKGKSVMQPKPVEVQSGLHDGGVPGTISTALGAGLSHLVLEPQAAPLTAISTPEVAKLAPARKAPRNASQDMAAPKAKRNRNPYMKKFMRDKRAREKAEKMANAAKA